MSKKQKRVTVYLDGVSIGECTPIDLSHAEFDTLNTKSRTMSKNQKDPTYVVGQVIGDLKVEKSRFAPFRDGKTWKYTLKNKTTGAEIGMTELALETYEKAKEREGVKDVG